MTKKIKKQSDRNYIYLDAIHAIYGAKSKQLKANQKWNARGAEGKM